MLHPPRPVSHCLVNLVMDKDENPVLTDCVNNDLPMTRDMTEEGTMTFFDREDGKLRVTSFQPSSFRPDLAFPELPVAGVVPFEDLVKGGWT